MTLLFKSAGATGHVFLLRDGQVSDKGLAFSGFTAPGTTVAVVPTTPQILNFAIEAQTGDRQRVIVRGSVSVVLVPATAVSRFNFTVHKTNGAYVENWSQSLSATVVEQVLRAVLSKIKDIDVDAATRAQKEVEDAIMAALGQNVFAADGVVVKSGSIPKIDPVDDEVRASLGARERQSMLAGADQALHDRRLKAAESERAIKQYEADTKLELERKQGALLDEQAKNKLKEAEGDAEANRTRLASFTGIESGKLIGVALVDAARTGQLGSLAITTEFLAAVGQK